MRFGKSQKLKFRTNTGAYSVVTNRENFDSQITATDAEAELLRTFFGVSLKYIELDILISFKLH
jgi:hypothetical protein